MKKVFILLILAVSLLFIAACSSPENPPVDVNTENQDNVNADSIRVKSISGLNEQIHLTLFKPESGEYIISYKEINDDEYTVIDKELIFDDGDSYSCYIIGLKKGVYNVRIEQGEGENLSRATISGIDVEKQDRSGYAHFKSDVGIGAYNNDGTVKDGAKIIYLTNENKNTVTLDINGKTCTGLVEILQANEQMTEPLIIRVLDRITTNQWMELEADTRLPESADAIDGHFESMFSSEYGENLAGMPVIVYASSLGKRFEYVTTPDGIKLSQTVDEKDYDNTCTMNVFEVHNASNITIEGVGTEAGFYQFGIAFHYSDSIEVRNLTIEAYPVDGLGFYAFGDVTLHGGYWIHHNTFKAGLSYWGTGDADGDESLDFADVNHFTIAYNKFDGTGKTMLLGGWEYDACLNVTFHHNYYFEVEQRLPLSRNSNIHNYNNFYEDCARGLSPRTSTYVFGEANHFLNCSSPYYFSGTETKGAVKSFEEIYEECGKLDSVTIVTDREEYVENTCTHEGKTDYTRFDTDPELFYYDAENKRTDVEIMLDAEDVGEFVKVYAGAGVFARMDFPTKAN